jgi:hypothetical protein
VSSLLIKAGLAVLHNYTSFSNNLKQYCKITTGFLLVAILFSCKQQSKKIEDEYGNGTSLAINKNLRVELKGKLSFDINFEEYRQIRNEKNRREYLAKKRNSNPEKHGLITKEERVLYNQFEKIGLIRGNYFLIDSFRAKVNHKNGLQFSSTDEMYLKLYNDSLTEDKWVKFFFKGDSLRIQIDRIQLQNFDCVFIDVINGGNKELVILENYHIAWGERFELFVYEIKIK